MSISVLILTLNEEINLSDCLESVSWSDDIVVFDSYSSDRTVEIAKEFGAKVVQREFDNWSSHQNWAVENIEFQHPWVFYIDADERCDASLKSELCDVCTADNEHSAFQLRRKDYFMGRWLKRARLYSTTWITRVFKPEKIRYERLVNPVAKIDGKVANLKTSLVHYPFSHGIAHWYARHNNYSDMEAQGLVKEVQSRMDLKGLFSFSPARRTKALKELAYRLPGRPLIVLLYLLFIRGAIFDGMPGIYYCRMRAMYEYMIDIKVKELRRKEKGLPV